MPIVTYEEMIRVQRANGLRKDSNNCSHVCTKTPYGTDEARFKGKSYDDVASMPIPTNRVCPHTKVVVPVTPAFVIEEKPKVINVKYPAAAYRVVDLNPCDGRDGVLNTIPHGVDTEITYAETVEEHGVTVVDTIHSDPYPAKTVNTKLQEVQVEQPLAVGATEAQVNYTEDGLTADTVEV